MKKPFLAAFIFASIMPPSPNDLLALNTYIKKNDPYVVKDIECLVDAFVDSADKSQCVYIVEKSIFDVMCTTPTNDHQRLTRTKICFLKGQMT